MSEKEKIKLPEIASGLVKAHFKKIEDRFLQLKDEETFIRETSFAMQIVQSNSMLKKADAMSVLECVVNLAQTDLTLNPVLKLAYLIPYREGDLIKCRVEPSYQGLTKLVTDTGSAKTVYAHPVYNGDEFKVGLGTHPTIIHEPAFETRSPEDIKIVYAVAILHDGTRQVEIMTRAEIESIRDRMSESHKAFIDPKKQYVKHSIWNDHFEEMAKKTVIKRLVKYLPKTDLWEKLGQAVHLDNVDFKASEAQLQLIDSLIFGAILSPEELEELSIELSQGITSDRASELITQLQNNQIDPVTAGNSYGLTEAKDKVAEKMNDPKA